MEEYLDIIKAGSIFKNVEEKALKQVLNESGSVIKSYGRGEIILLAETRAEGIGLLLYGHAEAQKNSVGGRGFTVAQIKPGGVFADVLAGSHVLSPVTVTAQSPCTVLFLPFSELMAICVKTEGAGIILQNLISAIADKYFALDARLDLLLEKSLRTKIYKYIKEKAAPGGSFSHKSTRQQLADYLGCERSALCRELSRMKKDGIITYDNKSFTLLK